MLGLQLGQRFRKKKIAGQRPPGIEKKRVGIEGPERILALEKKTITMRCAG